MVPKLDGFTMLKAEDVGGTLYLVRDPSPGPHVVHHHPLTAEAQGFPLGPPPLWCRPLLVKEQVSGSKQTHRHQEQ